MSADARRPARRGADAVARLAEAGVASPEFDAAELLAHVLGTSRSRLPLVDSVPGEAAERYDDLVARRAAREPLQHLTGTRRTSATWSSLSGPGVFVPRPETELLAGWAIELRRPWSRRPVVVDLCTGSGAVAWRSPTRCPRPACTPSSSTRPPRLGGAEPRRLRRRPAARRHGRGLRRPRRHRRRGHLQPAVHPARRLGVRRARGARPRPAARAVLRRRRPGRAPGRWSGRGPAAAARRSGRCRARRRAGRVRAGASSPRPAAGPTCATTRTSPAVRAS